MSADLAPWETAEDDAFNYSSGTFDAPASREPMQLDEYDGIRDDIREAMHYDRALLPDLFWYAVSTLAVLAQTGAEADNQAATQSLRRMVQRARTGVPMNEPSGVDL